MKPNSPSAFFATIAIVIAGSYLLMSAAGADNWFVTSVREFLDALKESTGANPAKYFRRVSLYGEARAQSEVLLANRYLQIYFLAAMATSGFAYIFVKKEMPVYNRRNRATLVAVLFLMLMPLALATVTYGQVLAAMTTKVICVTLLLAIGAFLFTELLRVRPKTVFSRVFHVLVLVLVMSEAVIFPALYGWYFLFNV